VNAVDPGAAYLTAEQLGAILQLSPKSVYRLAKSDPSFPVLKIGGSVRFPRERVLRWLRDREQGRARSLKIVERQA
jgi:predicted DNA-binding transcriptional regulator AlpA